MNILVSGTRGEGKSTLAYHLCRQWSDTIVIFDPRALFRPYGIEVNDPDAMYSELREKRYIAKNGDVQPLVWITELPDQESFGILCGVLFPPFFRNREGKLSLLVDEAGGGSEALQNAHMISPHLNRIVRQAPMPRILCVQTTHQLMDWNSASKSVMDEAFLFRQIGKNNERAVSDLCGEEVADIVMNLPPHHCVRYEFRRKENGEDQFFVLTNPKEWYGGFELQPKEQKDGKAYDLSGLRFGANRPDKM